MNANCCPGAASSGRPANPATGLPIAVIGAGPVGLAAAAHLLARGLEPVILESAGSVGAAPRGWGHVPMFSPWRYDMDAACRSLLESHGWTAPDAETFPTGLELVEQYLQPLADLPEMSSRLRRGARVTGIGRKATGKVRDAGRGEQPFDIRFEDAGGVPGRLLARAVIVATGTWGTPNPAGASGLPARGEAEAADRVAYGMPDLLGSARARYAGKRVLVIGSGHSAIGSVLGLAALAVEEPGTSVAWAVRSADLTRTYGGGDADQLPERAALGRDLRRLVETGAVELRAPFVADEFHRTPDGGLVVRDDTGGEVRADEAIVATGLRPDLGILREVRLDLDPALECPRPLAPLIDPNLHSCGTVRPHGAGELAQPDTGLFLAGMVSYGRAPTFLLATGYEQVRSIAAFLSGDLEAARRVELDLPQTGVCGSRRSPPRETSGTDACCTADTLQSSCCPPGAALAASTPCLGGTPPPAPQRR